MTEFTYLALDTAGREQTGSLRAPTAEGARAALQAKRLYVVRLESGAPVTAQPFWARPLFVRDTLPSNQLAIFTRQLSTLVQVTPLEEALRTLIRQSERPRIRRVIEVVHGGVVEGRQLSEAMAREPRSFPPLYRAMISAGERSGSLPTILERLAMLLERQAQVRSKVISALAYPIILAVVASFVVLALMVFVVPRVVEQFEDIGQQLPLLTRIVIGVSHLLAGYWWAIALAALAAWGLAAVSMRSEVRRLRRDALLLRTPFAGRLLRDLHAARMARTLATMLESRLPLVDGLKLTAQTVHNRALRAATQRTAETVRTGGSLSGALRNAAVFPPLLVSLASSGEASGQLDTMLERAADYLEREFDMFTTTMLALLEPAIIVVMGVVVAVIVLSVLLPILQIDALAGGL
ncbi:type II secretion system inner membrane protein GspF [Sphingosinicella sp. BN140058]|uniref:type II secretion system inner membrane protein GspF n=1 Tax=Sphingosinicella sp. BN140058 TaxID=1892855 RepID=UPI00101133ED|nr:type II secretion system inner membrane protein GspF [Sphingosinicella sp. BN140058]QAY78548.1 type II secretion system protein GspF [Sphingosinicella sp. BN140058]